MAFDNYCTATISFLRFWSNSWSIMNHIWHHFFASTLSIFDSRSRFFERSRPVAWHPNACYSKQFSDSTVHSLVFDRPFLDPSVFEQLF